MCNFASLFPSKSALPCPELTCINDMNIDMLRVAGRGVTLVLPAVNLAGVADDQTGGGLVSSKQ